MSADISPYVGLITSEHNSRPNFVAAVSAAIQPFADLIQQMADMPALYDLDQAIGQQLDVVGQWVGISRLLAEPLTDVYFSFGIQGVGWGQGVWKGPFDPATGLVSLPDDIYRNVIRAKIDANQWDGTIPGAYAAYANIFTGAQGILIQDNGDMTLLLAVTGDVPDAVTAALLSNGSIGLRPAGVLINNILVPSVPNTPYFGFGVENSSIAGWGHGAWGVPL